MARKHDTALGDLTTNEKQAYEKIKKLRINEGASYKQTLQEVLDDLGIGFVPYSEDVARGMLISIITMLFGWDERRDVTLMALGLIKGYDRLKVTDRREAYIRRQLERDKNELRPRPTIAPTTDSIRKKEDIYLARVIKKMAEEIRDKDKAFIDEVIERARQSYFIVFSQGTNDWATELTGFHDEEISSKHTGISAREITLSITEERIVDELHQRVLDGERKIDTRWLMSTSDHYIGELYAKKYHHEHDLIIGVNVCNFGGIATIMASIEKIVNEKLIVVALPVEWEELRALVDSHKKALINYNYSSDGAKDDGEILRYLEHKGVVFAPSNS